MLINFRVTDIFIRPNNEVQMPVFTVRLEDNREGSGYSLSQAIIHSLNNIHVEDRE